MRKSHLFVATLLLAAGAVSITGCLDNDEPLGIQELRSAKAELYRAQAALKTAEIGLKEANIKLKEAEVAHKTALTRTIELENQMREIDLLLKQDSSSAESARLQLQKKQYELQMDSVQEAYNAIMLQLQQSTAIAQHNYNQALKELDFLKTQVNDEYADRLSTVSSKLSTTMNNITNYQNRVMAKQRELLIFSAKNSDEYVTSRLNKNIADKTAELENAQEALAKLETIYGTPTTEWETQGEELLAAIEALQVHADTLKMQIAELQNKQTPLQNQINDIVAGKKTFTLTIPTAIQPTVLTNVINSFYPPYFPDFYEKFMEQVEYNSEANGYILKNNGENLTIDELANSDINNLYSYFQKTAGNLVIPDEDYAQAQEHLKTLQGDMEYAAGVYNGLIPQWENARDQFIADKDAYFINQEYSLWELTVVDVQTYYDSKRETTDKNTLVTSLKHYYEIRTALDNTQTTYFDGTENKVIAETLTAENLDEILEIALGGFEANVENLSAYQNLLGNDLEINRDSDGKDVVSPYNEIANPDKGSMGAFYAICRQLWGVNTNNNIIIRYTPVENNEIEDYMNSVDPFYVSDYEPVAYLSYANTEEYETFNSRFENRDTYTQFNQDVEEDYNTYLATVEEENAQLDEQKAALQKQIDEIQEQIDELQREQENIGENQALYRNILNVIAGYYGNATGETQTSYEEALTSLKTMIGEKQEDIVDKQQALTEANAMLEAWTQGLDVEKNEELKLEAVKQYTAQLENDIERLNAKLADEQKKFDIYTAEKDALLAVMIGNSYPEE